MCSIYIHVYLARHAPRTLSRSSESIELLAIYAWARPEDCGGGLKWVDLISPCDRRPSHPAKLLISSVQWIISLKTTEIRSLTYLFNLNPAIVSNIIVLGLHVPFKLPPAHIKLSTHSNLRSPYFLKSFFNPPISQYNKSLFLCIYSPNRLKLIVC